MTDKVKPSYPEDKYNAEPGERMTDIKKAETEDGLEELYERRYGSPPPERTSPALEFGTSVHKAILEGYEDFILQRHDGRTKQGKEEKAHATAQGYRIVKQDEYTRLHECQKKADTLFLEKFGVLPEDNEDCMTEVACFGEYEGMKLKVKLDYYHPGVIVDLKTISKWPNEGRFLGHIEKYGYPLSACGYINVAQQAGLEVSEYWWLFIESFWPHRGRWVQCPHWMLDNTWSRLEKCYRNIQGLKDFVPPTEVTLEPEDWWLYRYSEDVALEGATDAE